MHFQMSAILIIFQDILRQEHMEAKRIASVVRVSLARLVALTQLGLRYGDQALA